MSRAVRRRNRFLSTPRAAQLRLQAPLPLLLALQLAPLPLVTLPGPPTTRRYLHCVADRPAGVVQVQRNRQLVLPRLPRATQAGTSQQQQLADCATLLLPRRQHDV
jgi:hypothetical protein